MDGSGLGANDRCKMELKKRAYRVIASDSALLQEASTFDGSSEGHAGYCCAKDETREPSIGVPVNRMPVDRVFGRFRTMRRRKK